MSNKSKWDFTEIDSEILRKHVIKTLLANRGYEDTRDKTKEDMIKILKENYDVDDDMKPLEQLTIKQVNAELSLRGQITTFPSNQLQLAIEKLKALRVPIMHKMPTIDDKLLVHSYIHQYAISNVLHKTLIIPNCVQDIIFAFSFTNRIMFCLTTHHLLLTDVKHENTQKNKAKIILLNGSSNVEQLQSGPNLIATNSITLPSKIISDIGTYRGYTDNDFHAIFDITPDKETMYLIHKNEFNDYDQDPFAFKWDLPTLTQHTSRSIVYDDQFGLIAFVGGDPNTYRCYRYKTKLCLLSF